MIDWLKWTPSLNIVQTKPNSKGMVQTLAIINWALCKTHCLWMVCIFIKSAIIMNLDPTFFIKYWIRFYLNSLLDWFDIYTRKNTQRSSLNNYITTSLHEIYVFSFLHNWMSSFYSQMLVGLKNKLFPILDHSGHPNSYSNII